jgi:hypothetical protein
MEDDGPSTLPRRQQQLQRPCDLYTRTADTLKSARKVESKRYELRVHEGAENGLSAGFDDDSTSFEPLSIIIVHYVAYDKREILKFPFY